jgi:hypothetical protein
VAKKLTGLLVLCVSVVASLALGAGSANAGLLGCNYPAAGQTFSQWGDSAYYVPVQGGSFETAGGWKLSGGAKIVDGNNPFHLGSAADSHSLLLPPGSSALTPGVCLTLLTPTLRFVGSASDASGVQVTMYTKTLLGLVQLPSSGFVSLGGSWDASETQEFLIQNVLGLLNLGQSNIYFRFTPVGGATVQMDDVYLDPFFRG